MNSWQAPVTSEPSWGTPHDHYAILVNNANPGAAGHTLVDVSSEVPVGTNAIYVRLQMTSSTVEDYVALYTNDTPTPANSPVMATVSVASKRETVSGIIRLADNRSFTYYSSGANIDAVYIIMFQYWL